MLAATPTSSGPVVRSASDDLPPRPGWVRVTVAFTLLFAALHLYWAVGGSWGLPLAAERHVAEIRAANWVVTAILVLGAVWVLALNRPISRRVPAWLMLTPLWGGAVICVSHALFGFATKALYLAGHHAAVDFPRETGIDPGVVADRHHLSAVQDLLVFEPAFLVQGALLALVGWQFLRTTRGRRTWTWTVIAAIVVIDVFGTALALNDLHVAAG